MVPRGLLTPNHSVSRLPDVTQISTAEAEAPILEQFQRVLGVSFPNDRRLQSAVSSVFSSVDIAQLRSPAERERHLFALVNRKFDINHPGLSTVYAAGAHRSVVFNYHEKKRISDAFDLNDRSRFEEVVCRKSPEATALFSYFAPASQTDTLTRLHAELANPTLVRKDSKPRDWSNEILTSLLAGFVFSCFPTQVMHQLFDQPDNKEHYEPDFWQHLHKNHADLFSRDRALVFMKTESSIGSDILCHALKAEYERLSNHGFIAILIDDTDGRLWNVVADVTLYAEKFRNEKIANSFFQWRKIESATKEYIPQLCVEELEFDAANIGYEFRDCFVFPGGKNGRGLLLFQKNKPDETLIPCPTCRSHEVQGNSYSSIGVKSWECNNPICPDRSKFNRGKRYSFLQLLKQQAIEKPENQIPMESVRRWSRDVQPYSSDHDVIAMLVRHYTLFGDGVEVVGCIPSDTFGRRIETVTLEKYREQLPEGLIEGRQRFFDGAYFRRFVIDRTLPNVGVGQLEVEVIGTVEAFRGDAFNVLHSIPENSIDGAVTSPPYYNAREYSSWSNIYCYLYDMYNIARGMHRILKEGGYYLFNIFDYFDNENNISLSAMGKKRMILGAYICDLFRRVGFECMGNIVWDKGEIEGRRAFNNGNFSPYYQAPFNCWEHILVFRKPGTQVQLKSTFPDVLQQKPVIKMVRGENRHGHTAPFPDQIPELLASRLPNDATLLDPFAGSMTTGRVALKYGLRGICIELNDAYYQLGLKSLRAELAHPALIS